MSSIEIYSNETGVTVKGDAEVLAKLPAGFSVDSMTLLADTRVNAEQLAIAYGQATSSGNDVDKIKHYAKMKAEFLKMFE